MSRPTLSVQISQMVNELDEDIQSLYSNESSLRTPTTCTELASPTTSMNRVMEELGVSNNMQHCPPKRSVSLGKPPCPATNTPLPMGPKRASNPLDLTRSGTSLSRTSSLPGMDHHHHGPLFLQESTEKYMQQQRERQREYERLVKDKEAAKIALAREEMAKKAAAMKAALGF